MSDVLSSQVMDGRRVLLYRYRSASDIDDIIIQLINESSASGFLQSRIMKKERLLVFDTQDLIPLSDHIPEETGPAALEKVFQDLYTAMQFLEDSFIDAGLIVLDPASVFMKPSEDRMYYAVLPVEGISAAVSDLPAFLTYLIGKFGGDQEEAYLAQLRERVSSQVTGAESLGELIGWMKMMADPVRVDASVPEGDPDEMDLGHGPEEEERRKRDSQESEQEDQPRRQAYLMRRKTGEIIPLSSPVFVIGKVPLACDYVVGSNPALSRIHAMIRYDEGEDQYYIIDCHSTNHIYLNGTMIEDSQPCRLMDQMCVHLADEAFVFSK